MLDNIKTTILHIEGGVGKNIAATALTASIRKKYPEMQIIVVCAWDEVWIGNPDVNRVYNFQNLSYFYDDYIKNKANETYIIRQDPYHESSYILRHKHLLQAWGDLAGIEVTEGPKIILSNREIEFTKNQMELDDRPIFMIHPSGGAEVQGGLSYSWARDIPPLLTQEVINRMGNNGYRVMQIGRQNQRLYQNVQILNTTIRSTIASLLFSTKRLFIDSFPQHAAAALNLKSNVIWIANKPSMLGYSLHNNIVCNKEMRSDATRKSYIEPFNIMGALEEFPYDESPLFDINLVMDLLLDNN